MNDFGKSATKSPLNEASPYLHLHLPYLHFKNILKTFLNLLVLEHIYWKIFWQI